jgi:hypothetical protein
MRPGAMLTGFPCRSVALAAMVAPGAAPENVLDGLMND